MPSGSDWRIDWRTKHKMPANWHVRAGLENRFGPLGPTRVQIPPPPLSRTVRPQRRTAPGVERHGLRGPLRQQFVDLLRQLRDVLGQILVLLRQRGVRLEKREELVGFRLHATLETRVAPVGLLALDLVAVG